MDAPVPRLGRHRIKFLDRDFLLIGDLSNGAITNQEQFDDFADGYAHVYEDGIVRRYGVPIGTRSDITVLSTEE